MFSTYDTILLKFFYFIFVTLIETNKVNSQKRPNFILFLADDLGYNDLSCYGNPMQESGSIDKLAKEGLRFTQWYSADSLCTPSRAAILTGRYPIRSGIFGYNRIFYQHSCGGLPRNETTIPEALKNLGYSTGMVGKWHLGINKENSSDGFHLPHHHGFDFVGYNLPFTNSWNCDELGVHRSKPSLQHCFLYKGETVVQQPIKLDELVNKFVLDAVTFIEKNYNNSFFLYFSFHQIHVALNTAKKFTKSSIRGPLGDSINEMSWAVGEVIGALTRYYLQDQTLVIFLSDHGPHVELCSEGGYTGGLKGGKSNTFEGGLRVPAIAWWPGIIKPGTVSSALTSSMDLFPTFLDFANYPIIHNNKNIIDGKSLKSIFLNQSHGKHSFLFHYCSDIIMAVHYQKYKVVYYTQNIIPDNYFVTNCTEGIAKEDTYMAFHCDVKSLISHNPPLIFNINEDFSEHYSLPASKYKNILNEVKELIKNHKKTLMPVSSQVECLNPALIPCCDPPSCTCNYYNTSEVHFVK